jgi:phosphorylcholine metabolism protein LicD
MQMEHNNFKKQDAGCDIYGKQRLELAIYVRDTIMTHLDYPWFIENGTLLGAWRNGKFIAHDDDFDIAILVESIEDIEQIAMTIQSSLKSQYQTRLVTSYATKLEVFDPALGNYILPGPKYNQSDYHYVTLDLQFYMKRESFYERMYYISGNTIMIPSDVLVPVSSTITLEGEIFPVPAQTEQFLKIIYGSINPNAKYNDTTCYYEDTH